MRFEKYPFQKLNELLNNTTPPKKQYILTIGEPQFETPQFIQEALCDNSKFLNKYPATAGIAELRESMIGFVKRRYDITLAFDEILPVNGTREVLFNFPSFLQPKKIAHPNPFYQIYEGAAIAVGAKINRMALLKENNFINTPSQLDGDEDLVIINTPNNPCASVIGIDGLCEWVEAALRDNFVILSDECYSELYFDNKPPSILEACKIVGNNSFKNVLAINSISKRSSAPSLRSGYIAGDKEILKDYLLYRTYVGCASPLPLQKASALAWSEDTHVEVFRRQYTNNFKLAEEILGIKRPDATFYIWMEVDDDIDFTKSLWTQKGVKVMPGSFMGRDGIGQGYVRIALVYDEVNTKEALNKIKEFKESR
ncbi:MAG: succinyldiaminopimelate transaminase [Epsilonproteobacteria bacterium]|nr:succinyldiaminopimelate transaminase [Campylobacterota bacterium]